MLLQWFHTFLTTCHQKVVINGQFSDWCQVSSGVPQGSILGPLLFILYINDISGVVNTPIKIFADDVTLYSSVHLSSKIRIVRLCKLTWIPFHFGVTGGR